MAHYQLASCPGGKKYKTYENKHIDWYINGLIRKIIGHIKNIKYQNNLRHLPRQQSNNQVKHSKRQISWNTTIKDMQQEIAHHFNNLLLFPQEIMERSASLRSTATTLPSFSLSSSPQDYYNITNFYIPTLSAKKYNLFKLRELLSHKNTEKQNLHLRKKLQQPCPPTGKKLLSKDPTYPSFKCCPAALPHPYAYPKANNRRTLQFYNCKKKTMTMGSQMESGLAFLTEGEGEYIPKEGEGEYIPKEGEGEYIPKEGEGEYIPKYQHDDQQ